MGTCPAGHCPSTQGQIPAAPDLEGDEGQVQGAGDSNGVHEVVGDAVRVLREEVLVHHHLPEESCSGGVSAQATPSFPLGNKELNRVSQPVLRGRGITFSGVRWVTALRPTVHWAPVSDWPSVQTIFLSPVTPGLPFLF